MAKLARRVGNFLLIEDSKGRATGAIAIAHIVFVESEGERGVIVICDGGLRVVLDGTVSDLLSYCRKQTR